MSRNLRANRRRRHSRPNPRTTHSVQKARGVIGHRVKQVGKGQPKGSTPRESRTGERRSLVG